MATAALIALTAISASSQIYGGVQERKAANQQSEMLQQQAALEREEAATEAARRDEERRKLIAKQKVAFLANGIGLPGTAGLVFEDTFSQIQQEIDASLKAANARAGLLEREAKIKRSSGKASLIQGVLGATSTIAGNVYKGKQAKVF
jgi:hypothetical protein